MRQALEMSQSAQRRVFGTANGAGQRERRERIHDVMQPRHRQCGQRHQHVFAVTQLVVAHAQIVVIRTIEAKAHHSAARQAHRHRLRVIPIQYLDARAMENARLGRRIRCDIGIAIHVVFRQIQHSGRVCIQSGRGLQLKAGKLQHPHFGRDDITTFHFEQRLQHR